MDNVVAFTVDKGEPLLATITATAGNSSYNLSPGAGYKIKILYGVIILVTDATVQNRYIKIYVSTSTPVTVCDMGASTTAQVASTTKYYSIAPVAALAASGWGLNTTSSYGAIGILQYTQPIEVYGTDRFSIAIQAGVAGDSFTGYIKYLKTRI